MRHLATVASIVGSAITVAAVAPTAAEARASTIVIGQSIEGVKLGDTEGQVKRLLGKPSSCEPCTTNDLVWGFAKTLDGRVGFDRHGHVSEIWTAASHDHTAKGIHPGGGGKVKGSTVAKVRAAYPNAKCPNPIPPADAGPFPCTLTSRYHGRETTTLFTFEPPATNGVSEIEIYYGKP